MAVMLQILAVQILFHSFKVFYYISIAMVAEPSSSPSVANRETKHRCAILARCHLIAAMFVLLLSM